MSSPIDPNSAPRSAENPTSGGGEAAVIRVENFSAEYDGQPILKDINFEVRRREILAIAGESGSGKSTLLRHLIGLEAPAGGKILVEGEDITAATLDDRRRILRKIGVAFQSGAMFGSMTLLENVALPLEMFTDLPAEMIEMIALMKLQLVGLAAEAQKNPSELSGGMEKRAGIARALALDPQIIILDEPSAGLDPFNSAELDQLILTLRRLLDMTFVIVSHQLASIFTVADRAILLHAAKKTIVAEGDPRWLRDNSADAYVRAFFNRQLPNNHRNAGATPANLSAASRIDPRDTNPTEAKHEQIAIL